MLPRDVAVSGCEYSISPSFQLHPWSIVWFILAINDGTSSSWTDYLKKNMMRPCYCGSRQVRTPFSRVHHLALQRMWSQSPRRHCRLIIVIEVTFIYTCDLNDFCYCSNRLQAGHSPNWTRNMRTYFYCCRRSEQYKHVQEICNRWSPGSEEGVDAAVVTADIRS